MTPDSARGTLAHMNPARTETQAVPSTEEAASAFGAILEALSRVISPALIDGAGWERLRGSLEGLPVDPGIGFGFELRLGEPAAGTDFYIALPRASALAEHYIRSGATAAPGLSERLAEIDTGAPWCEVLGVEYDVASGRSGGPPGLFARIRSAAAQGEAAGFPAAETVAGWLAGAVGWRLAGGERRALDAAFGALAACGGTVDCVGIMPGRPERAYKVNSRSLEPAQVSPVLEKLRWRGPLGEVEAFLAAYGSLFRSLRLAVGVAAGGVLPRIGLELFQGTPGALSHPGVGDWAPFLSRLCGDGLCLREKLDGLLAWPGRELVFCGRETFGVLTGIAHLKVSFEGRGEGAALEAKAYPAGGYLPFDMIGSNPEAR